MALISPGVEVQVIDESQYIPSAVNTVPYFLIATAQNKVSGDGVTVAAGTTAATANQVRLITSQRDLVATYGAPFFYSTTTGTPINGYELNEYGLLAAYSSLAVTNRAYVQRVDIDLTELTASLGRPRGEPNNGAYWLNTSETAWGIQEWNQATGTFTVKTPIVINSDALVVNALQNDYTPLQSVGSIGDYAVVAVSEYTPGYYKNDENQWVAIGSDAWKLSWPTVSGQSTPVSLTTGANFYVNDFLITVGENSTPSTVVGIAEVINQSSIPGVVAIANNGRLFIYADSNATNDGSTASGGVVSIEPGPTSGVALLAALGINVGEYLTPRYLAAYSYQVPRWRSSDVTARPTGSVWNNVSPANNGMNLQVEQYSTALGTWVTQSCPTYASDYQAIASLDPSGGGRNIPVGSLYAAWGQEDVVYDLPAFGFTIFRRITSGATEVTGTTAPTNFNVGDSFSIRATQAGTTDLNTGVATIGGNGTIADFLAAVSGANVPFVSAFVNSAGNVVLQHQQGGTIYLFPVVGTPLTQAGFTTSTPKVRALRDAGTQAGELILSNWVGSPLFTYASDSVSPDQDPDNGRLWYFSTVSQADIMIQDNGQWRGYQNVTNDVRGFDLTLTNSSGPIVAASAPLTQNDASESPLELGDLWIDTSDLENYPRIYRWQAVAGQNQWVAIDSTDQVTENGILFADARWATNGDTNPVSAPIPSIESLLTSDYLDLDAPDPNLYPQGMLLFNTRRSGYNVKSFQVDYFNSTQFPDQALPQQTNAWVTASGNRDNGAMWSGRLAQRAIIIEALKAGIDNSDAAREEQNAFNIISTPGYPELTPNMIALSNERNNTLFIVADTPMRLGASGNELVTWATNNLGLGLPTQDGQIATSNYAASFYPSCQTTDLSGNTVVAPPSHMMVRTILRSDAVSYPWLAPAGTRRGVVDNAISIGYIDAASGEFQPLSVGQALRDILYERNINPITFIPGVGITNFGNKTSTTVTSALDRINVARLVAFLRGRLEEIGKLYLFEPNDEITRNEITNTVNSLMIDLIAKRAIYDYLVVCDLSNNTPARIDRNELWVDIAIEPVKAVEFIYIPLRIKNTGEISGLAG
jgi:hypothetical protein